MSLISPLTPTSPCKVLLHLYTGNSQYAFLEWKPFASVEMQLLPAPVMA